MTESQPIERSEILDSFRSSGLTQREWCQTNGVKVHTLCYLLHCERKKVVSDSGEQQWLSLQVKEVSLPLNSNTLYVRIGNADIAVCPGFDPQHLLNVIRVVSAI